VIKLPGTLNHPWHDYGKRIFESMNKTSKALIATAILFAAPLALACEYPAPPKDLPDGATSNIEEMKAGVKKIAEYQDQMSTYLSCIEADEAVALMEFEADDDEGKAQRKEMFDKKYNAAVEEQTRTVEEFNAEIREYKSRPK
jgi:hypothetical protein